MIAALPMYDRPRNRGAHQAFWSVARDALRDHGINAPHMLDHSLPYNVTWARDDLLLGHICNLPLRQTYWDKLTVIGASDYGLASCDAGFYRSVFVCRRDGPRQTTATFAGARICANACDSHSGYGTLRDLAETTGQPLPQLQFTGSHDASVAIITTGKADFAAIDAQTWAMMQHDTTAVLHLRVVGLSPQSPGQTFVTATQADPAPS